MVMQFLYTPGMLTWTELAVVTAGAAVLASCVNTGLLMATLLVKREKQ